MDVHRPLKILQLDLSAHVDVRCLQFTEGDAIYHAAVRDSVLRVNRPGTDAATEDAATVVSGIGVGSGGECATACDLASVAVDYVGDGAQQEGEASLEEYQFKARLVRRAAGGEGAEGSDGAAGAEGAEGAERKAGGGDYGLEFVSTALIRKDEACRSQIKAG